MSCYFVYGTLGAGKGIFLARKMREYLARGSRVATNVDLFPNELCPNTPESISRVPSIFRLEDLDQLGRGCPQEEKQQLGGLFLDEGVFWLNSRDWNQKGRRELIQKLVMIRKLGWDIYIAVQDPESVDKQALNALGEHFICCTRLDHFRIPIFSTLYDFYKLLKTKGKQQSSSLLPHINRASYRRGKTKQGNKPYYTETYKPKDFFGKYDTNQIFEIEYEGLNGRQVDMRAPFTYISGKTLNDWYPKQLDTNTKPKRSRLYLRLIALCFFIVFPFYVWSLVLQAEPDSKSETSAQATTIQPVPHTPDYLQGVYISGHVMIIQSNGSVTYDYALHDRYHRSFDYAYFALKLTPASPCDAWLVNYQGQKYKLSCRLKAFEVPKQDKNSLLSNLRTFNELPD
ncbi:zonular occludens toxin domain-containing protein [Vibrio cyclitrophicus]|uniref:zonular occludens toxin domain-containing protein n=1 Tax=Vibrio cyclitrophicus TaxID=47951 RepID=UPI0002FF13A2|nr:zonular occludens toxin domain-containing protein [Vibrio cyclitrophicus]OEF29011.1 hypothetical protein OA9_10490 [Vibrio cyclitrophicus 1F97]